MTDQNGTREHAQPRVPLWHAVSCRRGLHAVEGMVPSDERLLAMRGAALDAMRLTGESKPVLMAALAGSGVFFKRDGTIPRFVSQYGNAGTGWRVVIPVRGAHDELHICLSFVKEWRRGDWHVVISCPEEEKADVLRCVRENFGRVIEIPVAVVGTKMPLGFAANCNNGAFADSELPATKCFRDFDRLLFLNSDAIPRFTSPAAAFDDALEVAIAVGPVGENVSGFQNGFARLPRRLVATTSRVMGAPRPRLVGWCFAVRRAEFCAVGGWDEGFGVGNFDDDDLSLRLALHGPAWPSAPTSDAEYGFMRLAWTPSVWCGHIGGASFRDLGDGAHERAMSENERKFRARWEWALPTIHAWWTDAGTRLTAAQDEMRSLWETLADDEGGRT